MSKVIKAAVWKDNPHYIDTPVPQKPEPAAPAPMDDESMNNMLAEIAEKEKRASSMLEDARIHAEVLRQEAQAEHDRLIQEAQQEIEALRENARQEGRREGYEAGHEDGSRKVREEMAGTIREANAKAEKTLQDAKKATQDYVRQAEQDVVSVVMSVVDKILPQHFIDVPQVVLPVVREAIEQVKDQKELIVHVPPDSYDLVLMAREEFRSILTYGDAILSVKSDDSLKPGDCLIETPNGSVDARLATRMELLKQAVREVML
ncbi:flagellar assembly protein FliH [Selenomonas sp. WCA-380-WT-3B 3/]|uniref:Flagellar assembly protein FliH n=1 Tax=Selenomonas montiformis TaxID=2652285 RepID=A0A6I2UUV9_9FIRM|nr:FliH/SctL family protein [Selenomonas montiformis]MSV24069.1 flagellar assembly protein FliH [Selenomonas montiformis]